MGSLGRRSLRLGEGGVRLVEGEGAHVTMGVFAKANLRIGILRFLVLIGKIVAHLDEPLRLGEGRLRLDEPVTM